MNATSQRRHGPLPAQWPAATLDEARRRYEGGESIASVARAIGRPPASLWHQLRRAGVRLRPRNPKAYTAAAALKLKRRGWTWKEIGQRFGVSRDTARQVCTRAILAGRARA